MNLKQLRESKGFKQYKIAEFLGISRQQYGYIEAGKRSINSDKVEKLSSKFDVEPLEILKAWEEGKNGTKGYRI